MAYNVNESDLARRLKNSYVLYKGEPYWVAARQNSGPGSIIDGNYTYSLWGYKVGVQSRNPVKLDHLEPTLSQTAVQLGFCWDTEGNLAYLVPNYSNDGYGTFKVLSATCNKSNFLTPSYDSKLILDCIKGNHPPFSEALKALKEHGHSSFDRNFALVSENGFKDVSILYKTKCIGYYNKTDGKVRLRSGPMMKLIKRRLDKLMES